MQETGARTGGKTDGDTEREPGQSPGETATSGIFIVWDLLTQPPGPCGTHTRCPAPGRLGAARANLAVGRGLPGPRSPHRLVCADRTRPVEQRGRINLGLALPCLPLQAPSPRGSVSISASLDRGARVLGPLFFFFFFRPPILAGAKLNSVSAYLHNSIHPLWDEGHWGGGVKMGQARPQSLPRGTRALRSSHPGLLSGRPSG